MDKVDPGPPGLGWRHEEFREIDLDRLLRLRSKAFSEPGYDAARWRWEYRASPLGRPIIRIGVDREDPGHLIGHTALIAYPLKVGETTVPAYQSVDTFTDPEYRFRVQRVFFLLAERAIEEARGAGAEIVFTLPNDKSFPGFAKVLGFEAPFAVSRFQLPLKLGMLTRKIRFLPKVRWIDEIPIHSGTKPKGPEEFRIVREPSDDWDLFLRAALNQFPVAVRRNSAYMRWRYFECPDRDYQVFELRDAGLTVGISVTRVVEAPPRPGDSRPRFVAHLVDFLALDSRYWDRLLGHTIGHLARTEAESVVTLLVPESNVTPYFRKQGFIDRGPERQSRFVYRKLGAAQLPVNLDDPANWLITPGDMDFF